MTTGWAMPAYVPRSSSGISGWRWVNPLHVGLVDDVSCSGTSGARSLPQSKYGSLTMASGTWGALSSRFGSSGSSKS
jgi:hypothetical protein